MTKRICIVLAALLLAGGIGIAWHMADHPFDCSVHHPNNCDYNERYKLMDEHPELRGY